MASGFSQQLAKLRGDINTVPKDASFETEKRKRVLWRDLQLIKLQLQNDSALDQKPLLDTITELELPLSLYPHVVKAGPIGQMITVLRVLGAVWMNMYLFAIFVLIIPLRLAHPFLRKLGIRNNHLPLDLFQRFWGFCMCSVFGIQVNVEGFENIRKFDTETIPSIGAFQHSSQIDSFVMARSSPVAYKFVGKKSVFYIPFVGQMATLLGMVPIDRSNRDKAIASIQAAARQSHKWKRSIGISPEGTRSPLGQLIDFKKGAFHLALEAKVPITPMVIFGAYHLWNPKQLFPSSSGQVTIRFLPAIDTSKYKTEQHDDLLTETRKQMLEAMANPPEKIWKPVTPLFAIWSYSFLALMWYIIYALVKYLFF